MNELPIQTQINHFDLIKSILKSGTEISKRFRDSDFYEFEPNITSISFSQVPYIVIETPRTDDAEFVTLNHSETLKSLSVSITLVMSYEARSKFKTYANEILYLIESNEQTFEQNGFYDVTISLDDISVELIDNKQVVVGSFVVEMVSNVKR